MRRARAQILRSRGGGLVEALLATSPSFVWPLNDTSGTTARDISPNALNGTYNGPTLAAVAGPGGRYNDNNGNAAISGYILNGANKPIVGASGLSGFVLIRPDQNKAVSTIMSVLDAGGYEWVFDGNSGNLSFVTLNVTTAAVIRQKAINSVLTVGQWQAVGFTITGNTSAATIELYRNGVNIGGSVAGGASGYAQGGAPFEVGNRQDGAASSADWEFDGAMAYATIWRNRALPASDMLRIMDAARRDGWY